MKFVLFVEGHTEKKALPSFFKAWLDPRLEQRVGLKVVRFDGWPELINDSPKKARMYLSEDDIIGVIALLDLYGPTIYPNNKQSASERYKWAKDYLEKKVGDPGFRQYFAVHETEAWLLSDPHLFPTAVKNSFPGRVQNPEEVDFDQPPSKLLGKLYREKTKRTYKKVTHGKELFDKLDPELAYQKCLRLKELLDDMLKMAKEAIS